MKYEVVLREKNIKKEDLSKTLQTKIDSLDKLIQKVHSAKTPEQASAAKDAVDELDIEISRGIKKFNPEVHQRRLASIANINDKRSSDGPKIERKPKPIEKKIEQVVEHIEQEEDWKDDEQVEQVKAPVKSVKGLEELQRKAREAQYLKYRQEQELEQQKTQAQAQEVEEEEIRGFQKAKTIKPKGTSLNVILFGFGVFFLTWGTVNYFRTRKG